MNKVKVIIKSSTGKIRSETDYEYDVNLDKIIVTVDTVKVVRAGGSIPNVMRDITGAIQGIISHNMPLLVVPDFVKVDFIKLERLGKSEEEKENVRSE